MPIHRNHHMLQHWILSISNRDPESIRQLLQSNKITLPKVNMHPEKELLQNICIFQTLIVRAIYVDLRKVAHMVA